MPDTFHFDIDPHVVKQLGEELVSDEITALMELVKNAYDADASYVYVEIDTTDQYQKETLFYPDHTGFIIVEDDGTGMNKHIIENSWLVISGSGKRKFKSLKGKTAKGRAPLGDKGLGRLSTQRLADFCEIFTSQSSSENQLHVGFNWEDFEKSEKLTDVPIIYEETYPKKSGTKLVLSNLKDREVWKGTNLEKFKGQISQMISPYQDNKPFEVYLKVDGQDIDLLEENIALREIALSRFSFRMEDNLLTIEGKIRPEKLIGQKTDEFNQFIFPDRGRKFLQFIKEKQKNLNLTEICEGKFFLSFKKEFQIPLDLSLPEIIDGRIALPGNFIGEINEFSYDRWIREGEDIKSAFDSFANYRVFAEQQTGIKLYRNGFAVKPFGLGGDDWLRLGESQTVAASSYFLKTANVIGFFAIDEYENEFLKDKTDRGGLVSNPYSRNFEVIAFFIRDECNRFLNFIRRNYNAFLQEYQQENNKFKTTSQAINAIEVESSKAKATKERVVAAKSEVSAIRKELKLEADRINRSPLFSSKEEKEHAEKLNQIYRQLDNAEKILSEITPIIEQVESFHDAAIILKSKLDFLGEQLSNFSELAGLGLTAETVSHEFKNISDQLAEKTVMYSKKLEDNKLINSDIYVFIEYINTSIKGLRVQLRHLDPALKYVRDKKDIFSIGSFFESQDEYYKNRLEKKGINLNLEVVVDFDVEMSRGVFTQVVDNVILNAEYWLEERKKVEKEFEPNITIEIQKPWVEISDNGYGVSPNVQESLFEPFVTMKPKNKGRGLGLFIVQQLLDSVGCIISLAPELNRSKRKYKFTVNLSNVVK